MKALVLEELGALERRPRPLVLRSRAEPIPGPGELLIAVTACGVCHTELDEIEGRAPPRALPVVPGHQVVGRVLGHGPGAGLQAGARVGVAWIHSACGACRACRAGAENLCPAFVATGRDVDGGYAQRMVVPEAFAHPIPDALADVAAAPLLCAGAVGFRALELAGLRDGEPLGLTGFGASGHLVLQMARRRFPRTQVSVFARSAEERAFARELGAAWTGPSSAHPPQALRAIIDTTPAWGPVVDALEHLQPGGRLVINALRKEDADRARLTELDYARHLWLEKEVKSVANVTRADVRRCLELAAQTGLAPAVQTFALEDANRALQELRAGQVRGAKVLRIAAG